MDSYVPINFVHIGIIIVSVILILVITYEYENNGWIFFKRLIPVAVYSSLFTIGILYLYNRRLETEFKKKYHSTILPSYKEIIKPNNGAQSSIQESSQIFQPTAPISQPAAHSAFTPAPTTPPAISGNTIPVQGTVREDQDRTVYSE